MRNGRRLALAGLLAAAVVSGMPLAASAAHGQGVAGRVTEKGKCSISAKWKLSLRTEDPNLIRATLEVDEAAPGSKWSVIMSDNGTRFFKAIKTANDAGNVRARATTTDQAGIDTVKAKATNLATGEVCAAKASL